MTTKCKFCDRDALITDNYGTLLCGAHIDCGPCWKCKAYTEWFQVMGNWRCTRCLKINYCCGAYGPHNHS